MALLSPFPKKSACGNFFTEERLGWMYAREAFQHNNPIVLAELTDSRVIPTKNPYPYQDGHEGEEESLLIRAVEVYDESKLLWLIALRMQWTEEEMIKALTMTMRDEVTHIEGKGAFFILGEALDQYSKRKSANFLLEGFKKHWILCLFALYIFNRAACASMLQMIHARNELMPLGHDDTSSEFTELLLTAGDTQMVDTFVSTCKSSQIDHHCHPSSHLDAIFANKKWNRDAAQVEMMVNTLEKHQLFLGYAHPSLQPATLKALHRVKRFALIQRIVDKVSTHVEARELAETLLSMKKEAHANVAEMIINNNTVRAVLIDRDYHSSLNVHYIFGKLVHTEEELQRHTGRFSLSQEQHLRRTTCLFWDLRLPVPQNSHLDYQRMPKNKQHLLPPDISTAKLRSFAALLSAMHQLMNHGYLCLSKSARFGIKRYFTITSLLPPEVTGRICNLIYNISPNLLLTTGESCKCMTFLFKKFQDPWGVSAIPLMMELGALSQGSMDLFIKKK